MKDHQPTFERVTFCGISDSTRRTVKTVVTHCSVLFCVRFVVQSARCTDRCSNGSPRQTNEYKALAVIAPTRLTDMFVLSVCWQPGRVAGTVSARILSVHTRGLRRSHCCRSVHYTLVPRHDTDSTTQQAVTVTHTDAVYKEYGVLATHSCHTRMLDTPHTLPSIPMLSGDPRPGATDEADGARACQRA